jgi:O-antigen ligase
MSVAQVNHNLPHLRQALRLPQLSLWLTAILPGLLLPLLAYVILPQLGIGLFESLFSFGLFAGLIILCACGIGYWCYLKFMISRPHLMMYFFAVAWTVIEFVNNMLLYYTSINLHMRPLLFLVLGVPIGILALKHLGRLFSRIPHLKYYAFFWVILLFYVFFYNQHAVDYRLGLGQTWTEGSVSMVQFTAYTYCLWGILIAGITLFTVRSPLRFFDGLNSGLLWVTGTVSLITVIGYPFGLLCIDIDGFNRAYGIFSHPNPFAHHMGMVLIYMLGLLFYYQGANRNRIAGGLLMGSFFISAIAFLLALSKTGIAVFILAACVMTFLNFSIPGVREIFFRTLLVLAVMIPLGLWLFQAVTEQSFFQLVQARIEQTQSFNWRTEVWNGLVYNIDLDRLLVGHGFTAANMQVFQLTFNDRLNANPLMMVHNGYLALLYDMGIWGMSLFVAALCLIFKALHTFLTRPGLNTRPLLSAIVGMGIYFLVVCGFDEMTYMFDAPILFWCLGTLLLLMAMREVA